MTNTLAGSCLKSQGERGGGGSKVTGLGWRCAGLSVPGAAPAAQRELPGVFPRGSPGPLAAEEERAVVSVKNIIQKFLDTSELSL